MRACSVIFALVSLGLQSCDQRSEETTEGTRGETTIEREIATPSGDWAGQIHYVYGPDGRLRRASYEFRSLNGYDEASDEFSPTKRIRDYEVSAEGALVLRSEATTDLSSGELVDRTFYEPEITHWMTLAEARNGIQEAEQVAAGQPATTPRVGD